MIKVLEIEPEHEKEQNMLRLLSDCCMDTIKSFTYTQKAKKNYKQLKKLKDSKKQWQINFVGEAGFDAMGFTKEWFLFDC